MWTLSKHSAGKDQAVKAQGLGSEGTQHGQRRVRRGDKVGRAEISDEAYEVIIIAYSRAATVRST